MVDEDIDEPEADEPADGADSNILPAIPRVGLCHAPPDVRLPRVPSSYVARTGSRWRVAPRALERTCAKSAAAELRSSGDRLREELGRSAVDPLSIAELLEAAYRWSELVTGAATFLEYAKEQESVAWTQALQALRPLRGPARERLEQSPMRSELGSLLTLLGVQRQFAARAVATRKGSEIVEGGVTRAAKKKIQRATRRAQLAEEKAAAASARTKAVIAEVEAKMRGEGGEGAG